MRISPACYACILLVSAAINALLGVKVARLKVTIDTLKNEARLTIGTSVPPLSVKDSTGRSVTIDYHNLPTILYILSPTCQWCARNRANINALSAAVGTRYRVIGISLSPANLGVYRSTVPFPLYSEPSADTVSRYRLGGTPETIVVSPEGRVLTVWVGAYNGDIQHQVEVFFGVHLPGLVAVGEQDAFDDPRLAVKTALVVP